MRLKNLIICLLFCIASMSAKDIITKTDGTQIDAKVEEITESVIKYRKASNPAGPIYSVAINSVANIIYENGEVEKFNESSATVAPVQNPINSGTITPGKPSSYAVLSDDDLIRMAGEQETPIVSNGISDAQLLKMTGKFDTSEMLIKKAKKYRKIGWIAGGIIFAVGVSFISHAIYDTSVEATPLYIVGVGGAVVGAAWCLGWNLKANSMMKEAREWQSYSATIIKNEIFQFGDKSMTAGINLMGNRMVHSHGLGLSIGLNF